MMPARARIALFAVLCASALVLSAAQSESGSEESSRESSEASASASSGLSSGSMLSRSLSSSLSRSASSSGSSRLSSSASSGSSSHLSSTHSSGSSSHSSGSSLSSNSLNSLGSGSGSSLSQPSLSMSTLSGSVSLPSSGSSYSSSSGSSLDGSSSFSSSGSSLPDPLAASSSSSAVPPPPPPPVPPMSVGSSSSRSRSGSSGSQSQSQQKKDTIHRYTVVKNNNKLFDVEKPIPPKEVNAVVEQEEKKKKTLDEGMRKQVLREDLAKKQAKADLEIQTQSEALAKKIGNDRRSAESEKKRAELEAQERAMELNKKARAQEEHEKRREEGQKKEATEKQLEQTRKAQAAEQNNKNRAAEERTKAQQAEEAKRREEAMKSEEQSFKEDAKKKGLSESKIKQEQGAKRQQEQADKGAAEAKVKNQQEQNNKQALQEQNNKRAESSRKAEERQKQKDKQEAEHKNEESRKNEQQAKKTESTEKKVQEQQQKAASLAKQRAEEDKFKQEQKEKGKVASEAENKREQNAKSTAEQNEKERQRQQEQVQKAKAKEASAAEAREKAEKARAEEAGRKEKEAAAFRQKQAELKAKEAEERQKSDAVAAQKKKEAEALQLKAEQALKQQEGQPWIRIDNPVDDESKLPFDLATWQADLRDENAAQMQGANLVCQYLGYAYALEWGVDKTGAKAQNGNMRFDYWGGAPRVCSGCRHIFSFVQCQKEDNNAITVRNPRHQDGSLVDATTVSWNGQDEWGGNQQAANLFCRSKGYDGALRWVVSKTLGKGQGTSRFQGDGPQGTTIQRCQQCEWAFKTVVCRRKPNKGHRALAEPSPNTGVFSTPIFQYPSGWNFEGAWTYDSRATLTGDFNGDGKTDYARLGGTYIHFFISKGNGQYFTPIYPFPRGWDFTFNEGIWTSLKALDVNGDGKSDIVRTYHTYNHGFIAKGSDAECWNRDGWIPQTCFQVTAFQYPSGWSFSGPWAWGNRATIQGDFNGDGRGDYARLGPTYIHFFISQGNGQWWWPIYAFPPGWNFGTDESTWTSMALDLNGDGRTDIVRAHHTYNHAFIASPNQRCWQTNGWISNTCFQVTAFHYPGGWNFNGVWNFNQKSLVTGDFNGDGFDDYGKLGATYIHLFISKGNGQFYTPVVPFPPGWNFGWDESVWASMPQADFDGDGKVDIIRTHYTYHHGFYARGGDQRCFYVSPRNIMIPQDCFKITTYRYPGGWHFSGGWSFARTYTTVVGDFNGDGKDDYINLGGGRYNHQFFAQ